MDIKYKYKIGDKVEWINSNGVKLGQRTIIGLDVRTNRPTYYIDPIDTPWFDVGEEELHLIKQVNETLKTELLKLDEYKTEKDLEGLEDILKTEKDELYIFFHTLLKQSIQAEKTTIGDKNKEYQIRTKVLENIVDIIEYQIK